MLVGELLDEWLAVHRSGWRPNVVDVYVSTIEGRVKPALGRVKLTDLRPTQIADMLTALRQPGANRAYHRTDRHGNRVRPGERALSETTIGHTLAILNGALRWAVKQGYLTRNPAEKVTRPTRPDHEMRIWSAAELGRFLAHVQGDRLYPLFHLAAMTGMRRSELLGLKWREDVDLENAAVTVRRARTKAGGAMHEAAPKTKAGRRRIDLDAATVALLARWREDQGLEASVWGEAWADTGYVFTDEAGRPLGGDPVSRTFARRVARAGLPVIRFHDLRHTHAALLLDAGTPVKVVQERLGHSKAAMTLDVYGHFIPGGGERAAAGFAALIEAAAQ
jgi:integrase